MDHLFDGLTHLLTPAGQKAIQEAHVCIIGIGGVGSWTVEALARTGVGELTLIDLDEVCVSNITRQIHTHIGTVGRFKIDVMAERVKSINPLCKVHLVHDFLTLNNADDLLKAHPFNFVFDAIDGVLSKCLIINYCLKNKIPFLTVGASGALLSPVGLTITDLNSSHHDPLLMRVRQKLRRDFDFPKHEKRPWGIPSLYIPRLTKANEVCSLSPSLSPSEEDERPRTCQQGIGAVSFVTGSYGFYAASFIVQSLLNSNSPSN